MAEECFIIEDTITGLFLIGWDGQNGIWGSEENAICFKSEAQRQSILDILNAGSAGRFVGPRPKHPPRP